MASYVPAKYGAEYIFYVGLESVATAGTFQANATLASGDVRISKDGGTLTNLTTLPTVTPASGKLVKVTLSATEMQCDNATVIFSDASGNEWRDLIVNIQTATRQIDDLAYPTTSGRSIDVTTTGEVGIDWANIGSPTTTINLSGTTVKTATDVETDTADIQTRIPAALVGGRIDANTGAISGDAVAADSLEAALDGTGGVTITAALTGNVTGNLSGSVGSVTAGVSLADGAITAAKIATGAIDADALAADAVAEIQSGLSIPTAASIADAVWDEATTGHTTSGTFGEQLKTDVDAILDDTGTSGVVIVDAGITAAKIATNAIDADAIATDAVTELQNGLATSSALSSVATNVSAILADTGTDGVVLSTAQMQALADIVLGRSVSHIDNTASTHSLYELIQAILESNTSTGSWVIYKTNGSTTFNTRTLATDAEAVPIVGVS